MARTQISDPIRIQTGEPLEERGLNKQSPWDRTPWKPGQIPAVPLMRVSRPFDHKPNYSWGKDQPVDCGPITNRGKGAAIASEGGHGRQHNHTDYDQLGGVKKPDRGY